MIPFSAAEGPVAWEDAVELAAAQSGVVVIIGATDVGKSTLALEAANAAVRLGKHAAVLDADIGQGEVGPPGTMGLVRLDEPVATLTDVRPRALQFIGACSPSGHFLTIVQSVHRLVRHSRERGDQLVLVDTCGLVQGRVAEKLKLAKLEVLRPSLVLVVRKGSEIDRLTRLVRSATTAPVVEVQSPALVRKKSAVYRRAQRGIRMRRHFESARVVELDLARLQTIDGWLFSGIPIPAATLRTLEHALKTTIPHGEQTADGIYLCLGGRADRAGFNVFHDVFGKKRVTMMPAFFLQNLLVGLIGPDGWLVDVAILQGVNFERALFSLRTPARTLEDVRVLHFGRLRLRTDGSEIAHLRPGDL